MATPPLPSHSAYARILDIAPALRTNNNNVTLFIFIFYTGEITLICSLCNLTFCLFLPFAVPFVALPCIAHHPPHHRALPTTQQCYRKCLKILKQLPLLPPPHTACTIQGKQAKQWTKFVARGFNCKFRFTRGLCYSDRQKPSTAPRSEWAHLNTPLQRRLSTLVKQKKQQATNKNLSRTWR